MRGLPLWRLGGAAVVACVVVLLTACGGSDKGTQVVWYDGTPPADFVPGQVAVLSPPTQEAAAILPTETPTSQGGQTPTGVATDAPAVPTTAVAAQVTDSGTQLTPTERQELQPNELGLIPVLMYHVITTEEPEVDDGYTRTVADLKTDLQNLYDRGYYVVPLRDVVANRISAPAGKHPIALTFDDGTAGHFRYLIADDGSVTIDPNSAVGILEEFFAAHPDFGRGGYFAVPPVSCFDWEATGAEPEQTPYCGQKLEWLLANGYEVGNHTRDHADLLDLDDETFMAKVGEGWTGLQAAYPEVVPDILALPFGNYPDGEKHPEQRRMLREGFRYRGTEIKLAGALMVGANPAYSPASTEWDPLFIARIRAYDGELGSAEWLQTLEDNPEQRYTSDGDPDTITVPVEVSPALGALDREKVEAEGKQVIVFDPVSGEAV